MDFSWVRVVATLAMFQTTILLSGSGCGAGEGDAEKFEKVPMKSVYLTWPQKGLNSISYSDGSGVDQETVRKFLELRPRASNMFLVQGSGKTDVMDAGMRFTGQAELPLPKEGDKFQIWLVVYLGMTSSSPPRWIVERVAVGQSKIQVDVSVDSRPVQRTRDLSPYFIFVPLKGLKIGTYHLELRESAGKEIVMMRRIRITEPDR